METSQMISSVGHPTNTNEDDTVEENELRETFQIQVGPGDAIPGISPHVGRLGVGYSPIKNWSINIEGEANSSQFYRGDENNSANIKVPGYFLLNIRSEYTIPKTINGAQSTLFLQARNILDENFETGGILAENEVEGTGNSGTFVTPGQPFTIFGGMNITW